MTLELALLRAARPQLDPTKQALLQRVERLEGSLGAGAAGRPPFEPEGPESSDPSPSPPPSASGPESDESPTATAEAPAAAAEAQTTAVVEQELVELERVAELWPAVVDRVREAGSELQSTFFAAARPVAIEGDGPARSLVIGFPPSAAFNKRKAESQEARECLTEAVRTIVGERLRPAYLLLDDDAVDAAAGDGQLSEEELIARLKAEFDAEEFDEAEDRDAEEEAAG